MRWKTVRSRRLHFSSIIIHSKLPCEIGQCPHGKYCVYAHKPSELRNKHSEIDEESFKTRMCKHVTEKGHCIHGQYCQYAHKPSEIRKKPSNFVGDEDCFKTRMCQKIVDTGRLISEWLFDLLNFPKNQHNFLMNFCPRIYLEIGWIGKINAILYRY